MRSLGSAQSTDRAVYTPDELSDPARWQREETGFVTTPLLGTEEPPSPTSKAERQLGKGHFTALIEVIHEHRFPIDQKAIAGRSR
jgi:hypothetical protein